ncbi:MAG: hypothetical protein ABI813_12300 [Bacteroidota bacterium]
MSKKNRTIATVLLRFLMHLVSAIVLFFCKATPPGCNLNIHVDRAGAAALEHYTSLSIKNKIILNAGHRSIGLCTASIKYFLPLKNKREKNILLAAVLAI